MLPADHFSLHLYLYISLKLRESTVIMDKLTSRAPVEDEKKELKLHIKVRHNMSLTQTAYMHHESILSSQSADLFIFRHKNQNGGKKRCTFSRSL